MDVLDDGILVDESEGEDSEGKEPSCNVGDFHFSFASVYSIFLGTEDSFQKQVNYFG